MGKLIVGVARVLPLCAVMLVLPAIAARNLPRLQSRIQDAGGNNKTAFALGEPMAEWA